MAWTDPYDFTTDEVVTAPILDTYVSGNLRALAHLFQRQHTTITNSITNQTSWFDAGSAPVIPGGDMGASGRIHAVFHGVYTGNGSATFDVRVKFGGVTHITLGLTPTNGSAQWKAEVDIYNTTGTGAQYVVAWVWDETATGGPIEAANATGAVDTTADQTFDVSGQWSTTALPWTKHISRVYIAQE